MAKRLKFLKNEKVYVVDRAGKIQLRVVANVTLTGFVLIANEDNLPPMVPVPEAKCFRTLKGALTHLERLCDETTKFCADVKKEIRRTLRTASSMKLFRQTLIQASGKKPGMEKINSNNFKLLTHGR